MNRLVMKMKKQLYFPLLITLLASLIFGVLPWSQPSTVYAAPDTLTLLPDGAGDYTLIAGVEPVGTAHWDAVNDPVLTPDDATTYISTTNATQEKDAYTLQDTAQTGTINSVTVYFRFRSKLATKTHYAQPFLLLSGTETNGTEIAESTAIWTTFSELLARPGGGSWTWADINNLQVVIGLRDGGAGEPQLTQVYIEVDYIPPPSILNSPITWNVGTVEQNFSYKTTLTYFTITNNSPYSVNITISGDDMTGTGVTWTLSEDASVGTNIYGLRAGLEGGVEGNDYVTVVPKSTANTLVSGLASLGTQRWGLQLLTPQIVTDGASKSGIVTLTATQV